jgi:hypothetical protein
VLAPNGFFYIIPANNNSMYMVNVSTRAISSYGSTPGSGTYRFSAGALGADGMLYFFPYDASVICRVNPANNSIGTLASPSNKFGSAATGRDGHIYFSGNNGLARLDVSTGTSAMLLTGIGLTSSCAVLKDGRVIVTPYNYSAGSVVYRIYNPANGAVNAVTIAELGATACRMSKPRLLADGNYYSFLTVINKIVKIRSADLSYEIIDLPAGISPGAGEVSYTGTGVDRLGRGVLAPADGTAVILTDTGFPVPQELSLPASLADLPASDFNVFCNN